MKKISILVLSAFLTLNLVNNVMAKKHSESGFVFQPTNLTIETIDDVKNKKDDEIIILQGVIERAMGDDKYLFNDGTGTIVIEIDDDDFNDIVVSAGENVQITGEVDKGGWFESDTIDVKNIKKVAK